jgi:C-terminal processing protease CtpA/Prc
MLPAAQEATLGEFERTPSGELRYPHWYGLDGPQEGRPDRFGGKVYLLIDGGSGSSTSEFAAVAHYNGRATAIGEETGGTYYGNNSGTMPTLTLPNSGVMVVVPLFQFVMAVSGVPNDRGIMPDHPVTPTVADFVSGVDTELEYTLALIGQD